MRSAVADKIKNVKAGARQSANLAVSAREEGVNDFRTALVQDIDVEITEDAPTEAERKAVEDFFDWLFAEALGFNRELDETP